MTITHFIQNVNSEILNPIIILLFGVAFIYFIWGIVKFLSSDAADKARTDAKNSIMWAIFGMFVMFSVYGVINFVLATFQVSDASLGGAKTFLNKK